MIRYCICLLFPCIAIPSKANSIKILTGWKTKTCLSIRMSKPSARKLQLCNIKHAELCCSKFNHKILPVSEETHFYFTTRAFWRKALYICSVVIVILNLKRKENNTFWKAITEEIIFFFIYLQLILNIFIKITLTKIEKHGHQFEGKESNFAVCVLF